MAGSGVFKWWYEFGKAPERFTGPLDTREEVIDEARDNYPGGDFTICEADNVVPSTDIFNIDHILESFLEANADCWIDDYPEINLTPEQERIIEARLGEVLAKAFAEFGVAVAGTMFETMRNIEYFPPVEPVEAS